MSRARTAICSAPLECPSRPGLPTRIFSRRPMRLADAVDLLAQLLERRRVARPGGGLAHAGGRAELAERLAQRSGPLAGGGAGARGGERRLHDVPLAGRHLAQGRRAPRRPPPGRARRASAPTASRCWASTAGSTVRMPPSAPVEQRRGLGLGVAVDADDDLLAGLDAADPLAVGVDERGLHVVDRADRAAVLVDDRHLGPRALEQLGHEPVHDLRALEEVGVLEQVGLVGQHLLDAQRPLLVPRARQPERLVPGRQLDRARPRVAPERDRERLEHDALDVVLGLGLGQAERVDLHAVAEAQVLGVAARRSARGRAPPTARPSPAASRAPRRSARRR